MRPAAPIRSFTSYPVARRLSRLLLGALLLLPPAALVPAALAPVAQAQTTVEVPQSQAQITLSFAPVVRQVAPAVVNIYAKRVVEEQSGLSPLFSDPLLKRFFGDNFGFFGMPRERVQNSLGSGVIVSPDGLVVTNFHVIKGASEIRVVLADRREFPAKLVLGDEHADLSVLRIDDGGDLPFVEFKDSDAVEVGDLVLAIGNPFGVGQTVTSGIISALARTQAGISDYSFFIQTDAAINPGNSGGALVTLDGKLIGINTAIFSRSGGSIGIGFAIPANMVRTVVASAEHGGRIMRPWSGIVGQTISADLAEGFGLTRPGGVVVSKVHPDGPAGRAGVKKGDIILSIDGLPVDDVEALRYRVATRELGKHVPVEILRDHHAATLDMDMETAPETPPREETLLDGNHPLAGAKVANLSPALSEELDMSGVWEGVVLLAVERGSPAHRLGFRPGDVMLKVNETEIKEVRQLKAAVQEPSGRWVITFSRKGRSRTVEITS
jgi:serine protease Do